MTIGKTLQNAPGRFRGYKAPSSAQKSLFKPFSGGFKALLQVVKPGKGGFCG
jgi:hypothetical protein